MLQAPPVNIGNRSAGALSFTMLYGAGIYAAGAGGYGRKLPDEAPIPLALSLVQRGPSANPNTASSRRTTIPLGRLRRKQGYPQPPIAA